MWFASSLSCLSQGFPHLSEPSASAKIAVEVEHGMAAEIHAAVAAIELHIIFEPQIELIPGTKGKSNWLSHELYLPRKSVYLPNALKEHLV